MWIAIVTSLGWLAMAMLAQSDDSDSWSQLFVLCSVIMQATVFIIGAIKEAGSDEKVA